MKNFLYFSSVLLVAFLITSCNGCRQIPANQIVLNSDNYGKTWNIVNGAVPACGLPGCYNLYLPRTTMGGDMESIQRIGKTGESAKAKIRYTYNWEIADPIKFVTEAKELRGGGDYTSDASLEAIESRLIDRHFRDVSAVILTEESVLNFDQAMFETKLMPKINADMEKYGIEISGISTVPEFGEQLETALDAAQALELYKSIGEESLGRDVIKAKAGATIITLNPNTTVQPAN